MTPAPPRETRAWAVASAIYVVLAVIYCWPVLREIGAVMPNDTGDPGLNSWIMWWNTQAMPLTDRWWNAPIFFPMPGAFALSETLLSLAPISTPLLWMGVSPVVVHNVLYFLSFPTAALAAHALARRLTGRHDAALLAGLAFGFNPYRAAQMPHLQMMVTCWMPLMLLALHRYLDERRPRYLVLAGFCWLMNALTSGYLLVFFGVLAGLWILWFVRTRADLIRIGAALAIASLPLVPLLAAYRHWQTALGASRTLGEIEEFSADLKAIWAASERSWLASHFTVIPDPEGELYPGVIILGLTILGGVLAWRKTTGGNLRKLRATLVVLGIITAALAIAAARAGGWQFQLVGIPVSMTRPFKVMTTAVWLLGAALVLDRRFIDGWRRRSVFMFYGLAAAAMFVLALGPIARVFGERFWYAAPYYWLTQMPGGGSLRVPARFAMLMALCLSQSAAIVFSRLTVPGRSRVVAAVLAAGIAIDGLPSMDVGRVGEPLDLSGLDRNAVVFELPSNNLYDQTTALLHATTHGHTLINGYSGYDPQHFWLLNLALRDLDPSAIEVMTRYRTMLVVVNRENDLEGKVDALVRDIPGAQLVRNSAQGPIYQLPVRPIPVTDFGAPLKIGALSVTQNAATARYADDGALDTRWEDPADGAPGEMTIDLERPAVITRIELDIAQWRLDYPRRLRIAVGAQGADPITVWEGRTAGLAVVAAVDDLNRMPIRIDLPPGTTGQRVVLTLLEEHKELSWSVAEVRVWGK